MGERGPLPLVVKVDPDKLADLAAPEWLSEEATKHWEKHAPWLSVNNLLNAESADSWAIVCDLWGRLMDLRGGQTDRIYLAVFKAYQAASKPFRLAPADRPGKPPQPRHSDKKEFKL